MRTEASLRFGAVAEWSNASSLQGLSLLASGFTNVKYIIALCSLDTATDRAHHRHMYSRLLDRLAAGSATPYFDLWCMIHEVESAIAFADEIMDSGKDGLQLPLFSS